MRMRVLLLVLLQISTYRLSSSWAQEDPRGFREAKWGMTLESVQALFKASNLRSEDGDLVMQEQIDVSGQQVPLEIRMRFFQNMLYFVSVSSESNDKVTHTLTSNAIRSALEEKYGSAGTDSIAFDEDYGKLRDLRWTFETTEIVMHHVYFDMLSLGLLMFKGAVVVTYENAAMAAQVKAHKKAAIRKRF